MTETQLIPASGNRGPAPALGTPLLEVIRQPLYSAIALDAAVIPSETRFFQYQIGDTIAGAGAGAVAATQYATNMEVSGALATPKIFEIFGIRLVMSNITAPGTAAPTHPAVPADATNADLHDDMHRVFWGTHFSLHIGTKDYISAPSWCVPGNAGLSGYAAAGADDGAAAEQHLIQAVQGTGKYLALDPYTIFIPSQQSFHAKLRAPQATTPTLALARLVWCMLDGRLGREAQ